MAGAMEPFSTGYESLHVDESLHVEPCADSKSCSVHLRPMATIAFGLGALIFDPITSHLVNPSGFSKSEETGRFPNSVND